MTSRLAKMHVTLVTALVIMSVLFVIQMRSYMSAKESGQFDKRTVLSQLDVFLTANQQLREQQQKEETRIAELSSQLAKNSFEDEINSLKLLSGTVAVAGRGIEVTLDRAIPAFWLTDMIAQLGRAGAEALAINGIRYVDRTAGIRDVAGGIILHTQFLRPPFTISVIGPAENLRDSIAQSGGLIDRLKKNQKDLKIILGVREKVVIGALEP